MSQIIGKCPSCEKGEIIENDLHYQCNYFKSQDDKCTLTIWKSFHGIQLTEDIIKQLIENKKTGLIDMISKQNKPFQASIIITESGTVDLSFDTVYLDDIECPHCNGKIVETAKSYICEDYFEQKCNVKINKVIAGVELTTDQIRALLKGETTDFIEGFKKGQDSTFNAKLFIDENTYEVMFDSAVTDCPKCKGGKLKEFEKAYSCSNYKSDQSCEFSVWKYQYGGTVTKKNLIELCSKKETKPIDFKTKEGNHPYKGKLILSESFVVSMEKLEKV